MERKKAMTSKSPTMDFDKVSASDGEESKTYSKHNRSSTFSPSVVCDIFGKLLAETNSKEFEGAYFSSSLLEKGAMWISGLDNIGNQVLWHVQVTDFKVLLKRPIKGTDANLPTIMVSFANYILFTNKGHNGIYGFNTQTQSFETTFHDESLQIDAMCCSDDHLYIFQKKHPDVIQILDSKFQSVGYIPTGFREKWTYSEYEVDLCTITMTVNTSMQGHSSSEFKTKYQHMCIIGMSNIAVLCQPRWYQFVQVAVRHTFVRAVNETGVIWQLDSRSCPELDDRFNPCNVSMSATGDVFIADKGTNRVSKLVGMSHFLAQNIFSRETKAVILSNNSCDE